MDKVTKIELGQRIKCIRLDHGLNMREFGEKIASELGLPKSEAPSDSIVSRWEKGVSVPNAERLKAIADLGGISVSELLTVNVTFNAIENEIKAIVNSFPLNEDEKKYLDKNSKDLAELLKNIINSYDSTELTKNWMLFVADRSVNLAEYIISNHYPISTFDNLITSNQNINIIDDFSYLSDHLDFDFEKQDSPDQTHLINSIKEIYDIYVKCSNEERIRVLEKLEEIINSFINE